MKPVIKVMLLGGLGIVLLAGCSHSAPSVDDSNAASSGQPAQRHHPRGANPV